MSSSIQVAIKVRPLIKREQDENLPIQWTVQDKCIAPLDPELKKRGEGGFYFDHIFDVNTTNVDVFNTIAKAIIEAAVNGFNGTIFAYGQTSSGKTYTMMGSPTEPGVIPLSVQHIFGLIHKSDRQFLLRVSYIEIYNERVNDLLNPEETDLKIKDNPKTGQAYVQCKEELVNCPENVLAIMKKGDKNRRIGETNMNERSSRSHTILRITIESRDANADEQGAIQVSQLNLVDLAGSERAGQTGAIGTRFKEGTHINMSLSALGLVIMQLSEAQDNPRVFVNFRDSKLTRILQCSLGGNAMTTIICAVTPAAVEETQCTLAFASRAKRIKNKPKLNEELSEATLLKRYAKHITKLETELKKVKSADVVEMESKLLEKERANQILEERIELLKKSILCGDSSSEKEEGVFQTEKQRRRTWGGSGTLTSKIPTFHNAIGLPTIIEIEHSPEKKRETFKEHSKRRQSIIQQIDLANESFQTAFTDFELELIERERGRADRLSDGSSAGDDYWTVSKRPQRSVKFVDDVSVVSTSRQSFDETVEPKSPEQCNNEPPSPGTPKVALRKRISFLMETYNSLCEENGELLEFTKLEKQAIVDEQVERAMEVHNKKLAEREQMFNELNEKYNELQLHSAETEKRLSESDSRLAEFEHQLAQSAISLQVVRNEKQALVDELKMLKNAEVKSSECLAINKDEEKESSSIFENASYFEEMNVSVNPTDSVFANETQQTMQELTMCDADMANEKPSMKIEIESLKAKKSELEEKLAIIQKTVIAKENTIEALQQEVEHLKEETANITFTSEVREIKLSIEPLQQTVQLLTIENANLTTKEKNLQETIAELLTKIHAITEEKNLLRNNIGELEQRLQKFNDGKQNCENDNETASMIENLNTKIASLTAENIELSTNLMNKIEELDNAKDVQSASGDHNCAYRELSVNLSERNKLLESENIELSNNLMDKIEEYDQLKEKLEALQWKLSSSPSRVASNNLMEISMNDTNLLEKEKTVDDLLRFSIGVNNSKRASLENQSSNGDAMNDLMLHSTVRNGSICHENGNAQVEMENGEKLDVSEISQPTVDEMARMSILPNGKSRQSFANDRDSCLENSENSWKIRAEILAEEVKNLQLQNEKYKDFKLNACAQCAHLTDLNESRRALKVETKEMSRKLQLLQDKFERECADTEILRTKANEDLNISVADSTMNESAFEGSCSVSVVEDRVLKFRHELDSLRDKAGKLSSDYDEKYDEIEKLQDASSRETTPTPLSTDTPRRKRSNAKVEKLETKMDNMRTDLRRLRKEITSISVAQQKFDNEKASMTIDIESLKAEKSELEDKLATIQESMIDREKSLEKEEVESFKEEIERLNTVKNDLESAKAALEAEILDLKTGKASLEAEFAAIRESTSEKIEALEKEIERLRKEIERSDVVKNDLENSKAALEAEVQALKQTKNTSLEVERSSETVDSSVLEEKIRYLESEVARRDEEIENSNVVRQQLETAKLALEAEVETFQAANLLMEEKLAALDNSSPSDEKIEQLEIEVARLNEQIAFSENARRELEFEKSSLETEVESLKITNASLEEKFADIENVSVEGERIAMLEKDLARLTDEIETSNTMKEKLQSAKSTLEAEVQSLKTKNETLEEKFATIEADPSIFEEKIKQLEIELARVNEEIYKSNAVNIQLEDAKSSLETEVQSLITAKQSLEDKFALIENSSLAEGKIEHLESEVSRLNEELCALKSVKQELETAKLQFEAEIQSLKTASSSQEENGHSQLKDPSIAEETIKQLELELARSSEEIRSASLANQELQSAKSSLEAEVEFLTSQKIVIEEGSTELMRALRNLEENNTSLKLELEKITSEKNEIVNNRLMSSSLEIVDCPNNNVEDYERNVEIESFKSKLKEAIEEKNAERNECLNKIAVAEAELDAAKLRLNEVTTSLDEFVVENATLKQKLTELIKTSDEELTNTKLQLNNEVTTLRAEIAKLEESFDSLNHELRELQDKNVALINELENIKAKEEDKSAGEIPQDSSYETLKDYETKVEELRIQSQDIRNEIHASTKKSLELDEQLTKLSTAKEELNDIRVSLEREVTNLKTERADLEETLTSLRESLGTLEEKKSFLTTELEAIKSEKERIETVETNSSNETLDKTELLEREKTIESLNARMREITAELENYASENEELKLKVSELEATLSDRSANLAGNNSHEIDGNLRDEVDSARTCIMKEIKSLKPTSASQDFAEKSVSDLFGVFVREIMAKEEEIIKMLTLNFEREKRKLEESKRQSVDAEKRANIWAKELEAEIEKTQQDLSTQESKNAELNAEIAKLNNLLMESAHENQMLNEKMKVLELDFNTLQADLESRSGSKLNSTLNTTQQERERLIEEALATREMELSSKLRLAEKNYKEKLEELTNNLESQKMKNLELTSNLEGMEMNEKQLRNIVDMKSTELAKCSNTVERLQSELNHLMEKHNLLSREHEEKSQQIEEITSLLKNKCDKLSEYKTKLETISPEYEHLKEQAADRQVRLEKYKSELECITSANEKQIASLKDKLDSEEIKSAGYKKQLAELTNRNTVLQSELEELRTKCAELERSNAKMTKSLRNSTSRIRAEEEMEDLRDTNRTLQRNLDGAANRIAELQEMRTQMMKELVDLRGTYEVVCNENTEIKNTLATQRSGANDAFELRGKYELLLQEKNRVTLELEDKKSTLVQLEKKFEACVKECEELKKMNKDLDEEMEDMVEKINELTKENAELDDKLYTMTSTQTNAADHQRVELLVAETQHLRSQVEKHESEIAGLRLHRDRLRNELETAAKSVEDLKSENNELRGKVTILDRADSLSCDSSRSASPAPDLDPARIDRRRRRSRTELFNQKRSLEFVDNDGKFPWGEGCRCVALEKKVRELEHDLVSKNGEVAALEIRIQSENFPYVKRAKDLEELLGSSRRKIKTLETELLRLRELKNMEMSSECSKCKHWNANKRDQSSQCMPETSKIRLNGTSSGFIEEQVKIAKLEKVVETLKGLCRSRQRNIFDLEKHVKELEKKLNVGSTSENDTSASSSKPDFTRAMKENVPKAYEVLRPSTNLRRERFN